MARTFTKKHYTAVADALVAAYQHPANNGVFQHVTKVDSRSAQHGIGTVLAEFVKLFSEDSEAFDCDRFHQYVNSRIG